MKLHLPNCEIERDAPLTKTEKAAGGMALLSFLIGLFLVGAFVAGCGKSVDVEGAGMYANTSSGIVGIGSFEVVTYPEAVEGARIKYEEDTAWLSPSTKTHAFKVDICGSNSTAQVSSIVSNICAAFVAVAPQIAAANNGVEAADATSATNATNASANVTNAVEAASASANVTNAVTVTETATNAVESASANANATTNAMATATISE